MLSEPRLRLWTGCQSHRRKRQNADARPGKFGHRRKARLGADNDGGGCVFDEIPHLSLGVGGVERQIDRACLQSRRVKRQRIGRFGSLHHHAVPWRYAVLL